MICSRCVLDDTVPGITFDSKGVCSYCHLHDEMDKQYPTGMIGHQYLLSIVQRIKEDGRGKPYDCVVGLSGGCDSSYVLWTAVRFGLFPLAVHFDNGWNNPIAEHNMKVITDDLGVPLERHKVDQAEFDSINMAFLRSGVPDFEAPTDIALPTVAYRAAERYGIRWLLNGHSFRTEGTTPLGWSYMDGAYIADVCKRFGGPRIFKTYPNLWLKDFLRWSGMGFKRFRPLYYLDYNWDKAKQDMADRFGWKWYRTKHGESFLTVFFGSFLLPRRYGIRLVAVRYAALVRSGQMRRKDALEELAKPLDIDPKIMRAIYDRFSKGRADVNWFLDVPRRSVDQFQTYRPQFKALRPLFALWAKQGKVPQTFYDKYCK